MYLNQVEFEKFLFIIYSTSQPSAYSCSLVGILSS